MKNPVLEPNHASRPAAARFSFVNVLALGCACLSALSACRERSTAANAPSAGVPPTAPSAPATAVPSSPPGGELLGRSTFTGDQTLPWMPLFLEPAKGDTSVKDHGYCARIDHAGKNAWDVQLRHREMTIQKGHTYSVRYTAWASAPLRVRAQIGMSGPPYTGYWSDVPELTTARKEFSGSFTATAADDPTA